MKRIAIALILVLYVNITSWAQQKVHVVMRGETFATIAKKYGISEAELRSANATMKIAHTGAKLKIPQKNVARNVSARTQPQQNNKSNTQATLSHTSQMQQNQSVASVTQNTNWHSREKFNNGKKFFYDKKWKKAISEFNDVLSDPLASKEEIQQSKLFIAQAEVKQKEKDESRREFANRLSQFGDKLQELGQQMQRQNTYGNAYSYGYTGKNVPTSTSAALPQNLDAAHMKEFQEKGVTEVILWNNSSGKGVRWVQICAGCNGKVTYCTVCNGRRVDYMGNRCIGCFGSGKNTCPICWGKGFNDYTSTFDAQGNILTFNGKPVQNSQGGGDYYPSTPSGGGNYPQTRQCQRCLGTGQIPFSISKYGSIKNSTYCSGEHHVCNVVSCQVCKKNHCVHLEHLSCDKCYGAGTQQGY